MSDVDPAGTIAGTDNDPASADPDTILANFKAKYGKMGENLPDEMRGALKRVKDTYEWQNMSARMEELRFVQRRHEFFKNNQNIFWDGQDKRWKPLISSTGGISAKADDTDELLRYDFVTNIYGANCLIDMAVMVQNPPTYQFAPADPSSPEDKATSRAAIDVAAFISDNNRLNLKLIDIAWHWYNDGGCGAYTFWEEDGAKYGFHDEPITQSAPAKISPDTANCPTCGNVQDVPDGMPPPASCPNCQSPLGPENVQQGMMGIVPQVTGSNKVPNGQESVSFIGYLELERPFWAKSQDEFPWLKWSTEVPKGKLRSLYPKFKAETDNVGGAENSATQAARNARISTKATSYGRTVMEGSWALVTYDRVWLRPWAFFEIDDQAMAQQLYETFPNGCMVAWAGDTYLESRPENMDEFWTIGHAMPGDGQVRQCLGEWMVGIQQRFNAEENIQTETYERGIPFTILEQDVIDQDALAHAGALPGLILSGTAKAGQNIADGVYVSPPPSVSPQMIEHSGQMFGEYSQFLTGNQPSVFGGDTGSNDTARGISMVKESSLGVKGLFKAPMNDFLSRTMLNLIKCFQKNRDKDVAMSVEGKDGFFDAKIIELGDLGGNLTVKMNVSNSYPTTVNQRRDIALQIMNNPPMAQQLGLTSPAGQDMLRDLLGTGDFSPPGFDARMHQMRENRQMMDGTAVPINFLLDDHVAHMAQIRDWFESNDGQYVAATNPNAIQLIEQHFEQHMQAAGQQNNALNAPPPGAQPGAPPGAPPAGGPPPQGQ